jgi:hypothetical protein
MASRQSWRTDQLRSTTLAIRLCNVLVLLFALRARHGEHRAHQRCTATWESLTLSSRRSLGLSRLTRQTRRGAVRRRKSSGRSRFNSMRKCHRRPRAGERRARAASLAWCGTRRTWRGAGAVGAHKGAPAPARSWTMVTRARVRTPCGWTDVCAGISRTSLGPLDIEGIRRASLWLRRGGEERRTRQRQTADFDAVERSIQDPTWMQRVNSRVFQVENQNTRGRFARAQSCMRRCQCQ